MKVLRLTHDEGGGFGASCLYAADQLEVNGGLIEEIRQMKDNEVGEKWIITVEEMPAAEFRKLPESTGW